MTRAKVALIRTAPATVLDDYARALDLAGCRLHLDQAAPSVLRIGISRHFPFPAANTPPWQLEGVVRVLHCTGYHNLTYVQHSGGMKPPLIGSDLNGYESIMRAYNVGTRVQAPESKIARFPWSLVPGPWFLIPGAVPGTNMIYLSPLQANSNILQYMLDMNWSWGEAQSAEASVDLLAFQKKALTGMFVVLDGTTVSTGRRARQPRTEVKNVILASADLVAVATVVARLIGFDPLAHSKFVWLAHARGLGVGDVREIEVVGDADVLNETWHFDVRWDNDDANGSNRSSIRASMRQWVEYYSWPASDRQVFESWLRHTGWGRLFQQYQQSGVRDQGPGS